MGSVLQLVGPVSVFCALDRKIDLQLLSQCNITYNSLNWFDHEIHFVGFLCIKATNVFERKRGFS